MIPASNPPTQRSSEHRSPSLAIGQTWGNFEIRALVGRGSFGEVYRAWDPHLQREIALKILLPRSVGDEAQFENLLREARALASVRHPNIVPIYGVDRHDGSVGFWTDFVHGKTLAALVREQGPFGYREAALVGLDLCKALSAVHRTGLLHRDIKAENVMREEGGRILLMDFGLSSLPYSPQELAGTPRYMAPELFQGAPASVASDIYSVGALLFFLVAGQHPARSAGHAASPRAELSGDEATEIAPTFQGKAAHPFAQNLSASSSVLDYRPDLPETFARVIDTAIHPDPHRRFASAGSLSSALSEVVAGPFAGEHLARPVASSPSRRIGIFAASAAVVLLAFAAVLIFSPHTRALLGIGKSDAAQVSDSDASGSLHDKYLKANQLLLRYDKRKNVTDAIALLKDVLAQDPNFALAQAGLGRAYFQQYRVTREAGLLDQARAACNRAIQLDGSLAPPYVTLARIDAMAGNTALATTQAQKAIALDPRSAEAYGAQAEVYDSAGRGPDAVVSVQRAIDLAPEDWRWPVLLGHYYFLNGNLAGAADEFRKAVTIAPDNATALLDLGLASMQLERLNDAKANLEKSAEVQPSFAAYSGLAEILSTSGKSAEAVEMSKKALDLNQTDYVAWGNLASAYLWSPGGHDKAMEAYRKAAELAEVSRKETPLDASLLATLGGYYADMDWPERSLPLLRQAVTLAPENPNVLYRAGEGYEKLHRRNDAIALIAKSLALGFHANQLQRSPDLASLRADPRLEDAVKSERAKLSLDTNGKKG